MSEPEKYTLDRVLETVRGHAEALGKAAEALKGVEGNDAEVLAMVGERAHRAAEYLWEIEGRACPDDHVDLAAAWINEAEGSRLWLALFTLPTLAMAVEGAATDPQGILANGIRWLWCHDESERISRDLMAWVTAHEKDAEPATTPVEGPTEVTSKAKRPLDAVDIRLQGPGGLPSPGHPLRPRLPPGWRWGIEDRPV